MAIQYFIILGIIIIIIIIIAILQYSCLKNSMGRGAWQATFHEATKSRTWLRTYIDYYVMLLTWLLFSHSVSQSDCDDSSLSHVQHFVPHGLYIACQALLSMGSSRQEYWNG